MVAACSNSSSVYICFRFVQSTTGYLLSILTEYLEHMKMKEKEHASRARMIIQTMMDLKIL